MISEDNHIPEEQTLQQAPFLVIYNYRTNRTHLPKPRMPRPLKQPIPYTHSIILTRKMAAEIQMKNHIETKGNNNSSIAPETMIEKQGSEFEKDFFTSGELERGIPMQDKDDGDILYNLNSLSLSQSHSKLQKILFGFTFNEASEQPLEEQVMQ